jgi:hypothetical protein
MMRVARNYFSRGRVALDRPRLWRVTAAISALLLIALLAAASQGSISVIMRGPLTTGPAARTQPSWTAWCTRGEARQDRRRLAFCARVDGLVIGSTHGPGEKETHVGLISDFHFVVVLLPDGARTPSWGSRVVAVGPLLRARDGQREVQAFKLVRG